MVSQIKRGVLDFIGAARPSIADPFLPNKIFEDRLDEIRECIGCNICVAQDNMAAPIRCTQNPTQGEEWKRNWHPEKIEPAASDDTVLVVGAGPAGLECALQMANRGYQLMLAEARDTLGGRVARECALPGMSSYIRVHDYRATLLQRMPNVQIFPGNALGASEITELEIPHVFIATGSHWRRDGVGRRHHFPIEGIDSANLLTPDDILDGMQTSGQVVVYDDDHYLMGGLIAEKLCAENIKVTLLTTEPLASSWTVNTLEQDKIQSRLLTMGVNIITSHAIASVNTSELVICNVFEKNQTQKLKSDTLIVITSRISNNTLYEELALQNMQFKTLQAIGDCEVPGTVAAAVYSGHAAARMFETGADQYAHLFRRDMPAISN